MANTTLATYLLSLAGIHDMPIPAISTASIVYEETKNQSSISCLTGVHFMQVVTYVHQC